MHQIFSMKTYVLQIVQFELNLVMQMQLIDYVIYVVKIAYNVQMQQHVQAARMMVQLPLGILMALV